MNNDFRHFNIEENQKIIALAPMAGFTDSAFRQICRKNGADLVYSEMVSARGTVEDQKFTDGGKSLGFSRFLDAERPILVQIFGNEPVIMAEAAKIICEKYNPEGIDINMGCPARKVVANDYGSSLLKDPQLAAEIVRQVKASIGDRILSVKTRLGWENNNEILTFAPKMEAAGADMIAIHGRTRKQEFSGEVDWEMIGQVKKLLKIPVLANGGIKNWQDIDRCLEISGADGVLIGQAAVGRPWIFDEYKQQKSIELSFEETCEIAFEHIELYHNYSKFFNELKKHLLAYFKGFPNCSELRRDIAMSESFEEFKEVLEGFRAKI